jgi:hypothetical protein
MEIATVFAVLTFASLISFVNERFIELVVVPRIEGTRFGDWKVVIAFITGFALSVLLAIDFIAPLAAMFGLELRREYAGWIVSGIIVGCGSPIIHDILSYLSAIKGQARAKEFLVKEDALEVMEESYPTPPKLTVPSNEQIEHIVKETVYTELKKAVS